MTDKRISNKTSGVNARKSSSTTNSTKKGGIKKEREPRKPRAPRKPRKRSDKIKKTSSSRRKGQPVVPTIWVPKTGIVESPADRIRKVVADAGGIISLDQLRSESPIQLGCLADPRVQRDNASQLIRVLQPRGAYLFCGDKHHTGREFIQTRREWDNLLKINDLPHWIPNALTGKPGLKRDGGESYRCAESVLNHKYLLYTCEARETGLKQQAAFLRSKIYDWNIRAIVYSGGESLHAILGVNCESKEAWNSAKTRTFKHELALWGANPKGFSACCLSRLPGHRRQGTGKLQSLVWLASDRDQKKTGRGEAR
jgi:hypothetical protein